MNRKSFTPTDLQLSEAGEVLVVFSRLNVIDHDRDVTFPGAIPTKTVAMSAFNHTSWDGALPLGKGEVRESGDLGVFAGSFFMETDQGRNGYHTVKAMADLQEWSYGYRVLHPSETIVWEGQAANALRKLDIFEVSPVLLGAGIGTNTLAIKSGGLGTDAPYAEHAAWVQAEVKAFLKRTDDRAEWRSKEGRALSAANLATLTALLENLRAVGGTADELAAFLAAHDPAKAAPRTVTLDVLLATARRYGVAV